MNIPIMVTLSRIGLIPVFIAVFFFGGEHRYIWAILIYGIAGITDALDGYLSRKLNQVTSLGAALDPFADKLLLGSVLGCLWVDGLVPGWVLGVILLKEGLQIVGGLILWNYKSRRVVPANLVGKASTVLFYVAVTALLLFGKTFLTQALLIGAVVLGLGAAGLYGVRELQRKASERGGIS